MQMTHVIINFRRHLKRHNYSKHTVKYYLNIIKQYVVWLDIPLEMTSPDKIDIYHRLTKSGILSSYLAFFKAYFSCYTLNLSEFTK